MGSSDGPFQHAFFMLAFLGISNWGFWLPAGFPIAPAHVGTHQSVALLPSAKPVPQVPPHPTAKSSATISLLATGERAASRSTGSEVTSGPEGNAPSSPNSNQGSFSPTQLDTRGELKPQAPLVALGALAPSFIENRGQFDEHVKFQLRGSGKTVWLTDKGLVFDFLRTRSERHSLKPEFSESSSNSPMPPSVQFSLKANVPQEAERLVFNEEFLDASAGMNVEATGAHPGSYNFMSGNDPAKWQTQVREYGEVIYRDVWEGIDIHRSTGRRFESCPDSLSRN
jgi:hypothetical protein